MSVFAGCAVLDLAWKERLSEHYEKIFCYCFPEKYGKCFDILSEISLLLFLSKYNLKFCRKICLLLVFICVILLLPPSVHYPGWSVLLDASLNYILKTIYGHHNVDYGFMI